MRVYFKCIDMLLDLNLFCGIHILVLILGVSLFHFNVKLKEVLHVVGDLHFCFQAGFACPH